LLIGKNKPLKYTGFTIIFHTQVHPINTQKEWAGFACYPAIQKIEVR